MVKLVQEYIQVIVEELALKLHICGLFMQRNCFSVDETVIIDVYDVMGMRNKSYF